MRAVSPDLGGWPERVIAENQLEYLPLPVAFLPYTDGSVGMWTRYTLTPDERRQIAAGADIFIGQLGFLAAPRFTPQMVQIGDDGLRADSG